MRDIATKIDDTGDTLSAGDFNALQSELERVVTDSDQSLDPAGGADTDLDMLGKAISAYANAGASYQDSGAADAYVLSINSNLQSVTKYYSNMTVTFKAGNSNTGASTVNINGLGLKDITTPSGSVLVANNIIAAKYISLVYNLSDDRFEIKLSLSEDTPIANTESGLAGVSGIVSRQDHEHPAMPMIIWRMINSEASGSQFPLGGGGSDWEISDDIENESPLGSGSVTESSGTFSFATTGYWAARAYAKIDIDATSTATVAFTIRSTDDDSTYSIIGIASPTNASGSARLFTVCAIEVLIRVADVSNDKIRLGQSGLGLITGSGVRNETYIVFEKKADLD